MCCVGHTLVSGVETDEHPWKGCAPSRCRTLLKGRLSKGGTRRRGLAESEGRGHTCTPFRLLAQRGRSRRLRRLSCTGPPEDRKGPERAGRRRVGFAPQAPNRCRDQRPSSVAVRPSRLRVPLLLARESTTHSHTQKRALLTALIATDVLRGHLAAGKMHGKVVGAFLALRTACRHGAL